MTLAVSLIHTGTALSCDAIERTLRDAVSARTKTRVTFEVDLFVFSSAAGPPMGPMCLSVLPVVTSEARPGVSLQVEVARSLSGPTSLLSSMSTSQGDIARVLDRWTESAAQWTRTTEVALERSGIDGRTNLSPEQREALEDPLETARVHYVVDVPERGDCVLVLTFIATGGAFLSPQLAHADDLVRAFRWTMPARTGASSTSADLEDAS
ncbi:hypothetical protein [Frigoribacterium sp. VKM Ac-2836]|uniref:hypothetical protein n=1 Tax=Frigoribacterium sp. VKM Ac-2836 TaxID=2739014 RepID=UPI001564C17E|nr:hypothetical protein [Frigoribacterium sp. VKM Ac-2836]